ncbi:hypothetical protein ACEPAH_4291 [Sanghuangporus vaninii]
MMRDLPTAIAKAAFPTVILFLSVLVKWSRSYFMRRTTVLGDIPNIGEPRADLERLKGTAVICGGSIAGLWTARICADHFEDVVVVEPEGWLSTGDGCSDIFDETGTRIGGSGLRPRTRVPQYRAQHGRLNVLSFVALKQLFPNFEDEIRRVDGRIAKAEYNLQVSDNPNLIHMPEVVYPNQNYAQCFFVTRESYERILRRLVTGYSNRIRWVVGTATGLIVDEHDPATITSVAVRTDSETEMTIPASLVIDCTGGSQAGFKWLKRVFSDPEYSALLYQNKSIPRRAIPFDDGLKIEYNTVHRYRKFRVSVPPELRSHLPIPGGYENAAWLHTYLPRPGLDRKLFMIERMEGHRIELAFGGWGDPPLPETFSEVKDWLGNLEKEKETVIPAWIYELVDTLLKIDGDHETELGRYPSYSWIRYERAPYIPSNFVAVGDAVMRVNPTYGQGCSKAAIGAITLDSLLRRPSMLRSTTIPQGFGRKFFKFHSSRIASTWDGTKPIDYQWDTTIPVKGEKLSDERINGKVAALLMQLAATDESVNSAVWHVRTFLAPSTDLMHPWILAKVLLLYLRQQLGQA